MDINLYKTIVETIKNHRGLTSNCYKRLQDKHPTLNKGTLWSIMAHEYQRRMRLNHIKTHEVINKYYKLYKQSIANGEEPGILLRIAEEFDVTPCLIARVVLQKHYELINDEQGGLNSVNFKIYLRDTSLIEDENLAYEVYLCTLNDEFYSPIVDTMRMNLGQEYEIKLHREIARLGLAFRDEEHMRARGYDKTPDVKLEVPVAIDGFIVNWIESKALFGDEYVHKDYMQKQYSSYWNRFGSGLVIYWFGYIETLTQTGDKRFIIRDNLPSNIVHIVKPKESTENIKKIEDVSIEFV